MSCRVPPSTKLTLRSALVGLACTLRLACSLARSLALAHCSSPRSPPPAPCWWRTWWGGCRCSQAESEWSGLLTRLRSCPRLLPAACPPSCQLSLLEWDSLTLTVPVDTRTLSSSRRPARPFFLPSPSASVCPFCPIVPCTVVLSVLYARVRSSDPPQTDRVEVRAHLASRGLFQPRPPNVRRVHGSCKARSRVSLSVRSVV